MKKMLWLLPVLSLLLCILPVRLARAEENAEIPATPPPELQEGLDIIWSQADLSAWDAWFAAQDGEMQAAWGNDAPSEYLYKLLFEAESPGFDGFLQTLLGTAQAFLPSLLGQLLLYLGISVMGSLLSGLQKEGGLYQTGRMLFIALAGTLVLSSVWTQLFAARDSLQSVGNIADIFLPILSGVLFLLGGAASAAAAQAGFTALSGTVIGIFVHAVFPLSICAGVLGITDALSGTPRLAGFAQLCKTAGKWIVNICTIVFSFVAGISGLLANSTDSILLKSSKLAVGGLPLAGGLISGGLDTAYSCIALFRQGVGITGILLGFYWLLRPVLLLYAHALCLRAASALTLPLGDTKLSAVYARAADMLMQMLAALLAAGVMLLVSIGVCMGVGR